MRRMAGVEEGGATMTTPGGTRTPLRKVQHNFLRARRTGLSHRVGSRAQPGSDPSLCPSPMPQGVSYVQISGLVVYIRNIIPDDRGILRRRSWAYRGGAMHTFTPA
jgi:hypothetical protein